MQIIGIADAIRLGKTFIKFIQQLERRLEFPVLIILKRLLENGASLNLRELLIFHEFVKSRFGARGGTGIRIMGSQPENRIDRILGIRVALRKKPCFTLRRDFIPHAVIHMNQPERGTRRQRIFRILADNPRIHRHCLFRLLRGKCQECRTVKSLRHKIIFLLRRLEKLFIQLPRLFQQSLHLIGGSLHEEDIDIFRLGKFQLLQIVQQGKSLIRLLRVKGRRRGKIKRPGSQCRPSSCDFTVYANRLFHLSMRHQHLTNQKLPVRLLVAPVVGPDQLFRILKTVLPDPDHGMPPQSLPLLFRRGIDVGINGLIKLKRTLRIAGLLQQTRRIQLRIGIDQ